MIRLATRGLLARRVATVLAAAGLLTAVSGFLVLAGVSRTTQAVLSGDIAHAWNTPYDILVRPIGSQSALEQGEGLVRPNFLSGLTGGITEAQLAAIRAVPGVAVAAPIAVVGLVQWPAAFPVDLAGQLGPGPITVFRIEAQASGEAGLSHYPPAPAQYLVAAPGPHRAAGGHPDRPAGRPRARGGDGPHRLHPDCRVLGRLTPSASLEGAFRSSTPGLDLSWSEPIVVAGVDPVAEAQARPPRSLRRVGPLPGRFRRARHGVLAGRATAHHPGARERSQLHRRDDDDHHRAGGRPRRGARGRRSGQPSRAGRRWRRTPRPPTTPTKPSSRRWPTPTTTTPRRTGRPVRRRHRQVGADHLAAQLHDTRSRDLQQLGGTAAQRSAPEPRPGRGAG